MGDATNRSTYGVKMGEALFGNPQQWEHIDSKRIRSVRIGPNDRGMRVRSGGIGHPTFALTTCENQRDRHA